MLQRLLRLCTVDVLECRIAVPGLLQHMVKILRRGSSCWYALVEQADVVEKIDVELLMILNH